jgi:hypothetical protein
MQQPGHPLAFLVADGRLVSSQSRRFSDLIGSMSCDAGHLYTSAAGAHDALALEASYNNRDDGFSVERKHVIMQKAAIDIEGIPVEKRTAIEFEALGFLDKGTGAAARSSPGWTG